MPTARLVLPAESMRIAALYGNWFGPPSAQCVHRDAVAEHFEFGTLPWSADLAFCVDVAARVPVAYTAEPLTEFHVSGRQFHSHHNGSLSTLLQEGLVRHEAIERFETLTADADETARLLRNVEATLAGHILLVAIRRVGLYCLLANTARLAVRKLVSGTLGRWRARVQCRKCGDRDALPISEDGGTGDLLQGVIRTDQCELPLNRAELGDGSLSRRQACD